MRKYEILIHHNVQKIIKKLPKNLILEMLNSMNELADNPRPNGSKKLKGYKNLWRIRVGEWRIIYAIEDERLIVVVVELATPGQAYKDL
ncbi:MAG: type II toxin-antitoxin system RelE family toxin [Athalassotoga sp.]|uniref:type II toxin-antitoxin system RelE family toxin n=1 Tax=Athalassotoga sp. TaxID=2022597 RepID=UPI003D08D2C8